MASPLWTANLLNSNKYLWAAYKMLGTCSHGAYFLLQEIENEQKLI
jgi:hypothetical protein